MEEKFEEVPTEQFEEVAEEIQVEEPAEGMNVEESEEEVPTDTPPVRPKKSVQERIDEITKARREAERETDYWKRVALERAEKEKAAPTQSLPVSDRPRYEQFETQEQYEDALIEWHNRRKVVEFEIANRRNQEQRLYDELQRQVNSLKAEYDDIEEVVENPVFTSAMRFSILHAENKAAVAYHLGRPENRELAEKIGSLPVELVAMEIGKLDAKLSITKGTKKVSGAPKPLTPLGMSGGGGVIDESKLTDDEWYALERKRQREKIETRYKPR